MKVNIKTIYISALALWCICISGIFGNAGLLQAYRLSQARRDILLRIKSLESEKIQLEQSLQALLYDSYTQEITIRKNLGFTRDHELVFEFK